MIKFNKFAGDFQKHWAAGHFFRDNTPKHWRHKVWKAFMGPSKAPARFQRDDKGAPIKGTEIYYQEDLVPIRKEVDEAFEAVANRLHLNKGEVVHAVATGQPARIVSKLLSRELNTRKESAEPLDRATFEKLLVDTGGNAFGLTAPDPEVLKEEAIALAKLQQKLKAKKTSKGVKRDTKVYSKGKRGHQVTQQQPAAVSAELHNA